MIRFVLAAMLAVILAAGTAWGITAAQPPLTGATGARGPSGSPGPRGPAGETGGPGATGEAGATGPGGANGAPGPTGAPGATGSAGPAGATGAKGASGLVGPDGASGPAGGEGPIGATGLDGPAGAAGAAGADGPAGPMAVLTATTTNQSGSTDPFPLPSGLWLVTSTATIEADTAGIVLACELTVNAPVGGVTTQNYYFTGSQEHDTVETYRGAVVFSSDGDPARTATTTCTAPVSFTVVRITTTATRVSELTP